MIIRWWFYPAVLFVSLIFVALGVAGLTIQAFLHNIRAALSYSFERK